MIRNPRSHIARVVLLLVLAAGCTSARHRPYQDKNMDFGAIRTVAVLPFTNLTRDNLAGERVREVFASTLLSTGAVLRRPSRRGGAHRRARGRRDPVHPRDRGGREARAPRSRRTPCSSGW